MSAECGTPGGYSKHIRNREATCAACREARRVYMATLRATNSKARERDREDTRLVYKALREVRDAHPDEYRAALDRIRAESVERRALALLRKAAER